MTRLLRITQVAVRQLRHFASIRQLEVGYVRTGETMMAKLGFNILLEIADAAIANWRTFMDRSLIFVSVTSRYFPGTFCFVFPAAVAAFPPSSPYSHCLQSVKKTPDFSVLSPPSPPTSMGFMSPTILSSIPCSWPPCSSSLLSVISYSRWDT